MSRPQEHLATTVATHGSGDATASVRALLELGMKKKLQQEKEQRAAEGKDVREYAYVSEAGKCPRQVFFALTNEPKTEELTLDSYVNLRLGSKAESIYIELLEAAGVKVLTQERVELDGDGEKVVGKLDLVIEVPEEIREIVPGLDPREVWELKTKNSRALGWMLKKGGPEVSDPYVKQIGAYLHAVLGAGENDASSGVAPTANTAERPGSRPEPSRGNAGSVSETQAATPALKPTHARGRLIYTASGATKGEPLFHAWFVPYDRESVTQDLKVLGQAMKGAREGRDPGVPEGYQPGKFPCSYCEFLGKCWRAK